MFRRSAPLLCWMLLGCATPVRQPPSSSTSAALRSESRLSMELLVLRPEGGIRSVGRGDSVKIGEGYNLRVETDRQVYLTVLLAGSGGQRTLLPQPGKAVLQTQPGIPTLIPESDALTVDPGQEKIILIASPRPLGPEELQAQAARAREATEEQDRDPPPASNPANRPGERRKLQLVSFDPDGCASMWFVLPRK